MASRYEEHYELIEKLIKEGRSYEAIGRILRADHGVNFDSGNFNRWIKARRARLQKKMRLLFCEVDAHLSEASSLKSGNVLIKKIDEKSKNDSKKEEKSIEKRSKSETLDALKNLARSEAGKEKLL